MKDLYLDIDGTLISKSGILRPHIDTLLLTAINKGYTIFIWSGGGIEYAQKEINNICLVLNITITYTIIEKDFKNVRYMNENSICVDDFGDVCSMFRDFKGLGFRVPYYSKQKYPNDTELKRISELL